MKTIRVTATGIILCLLSMFVLDISHAQTGKFRKTRININDNGKSTFHWENGRYKLQVEFEGDIEWKDDDSGIKSMTRGSYLEVEERTQREKHRLVVDAVSNSEINYSYRLNGKRRPFDEDAQAWFAEVLPMFIRESGIGVESRTKRILLDTGVDGVLEEVDLIGSPSVKTLYLLYMFEHATLTGDEAAKAARASSGISSPGDKARFLRATAKVFFLHEEAIAPYFDTVRSISSPGDKTRVLIHLLEEGVLEDSYSYGMAMKTAESISSPGDKARFLRAAVPYFQPGTAEAYIKTANTISSPGDHARVLMALLDHEKLELEAMEQLLSSAKKISSPGDKARVLMQAANHMDEFGVSEGAVELYLDAARTVSSPGDRARVLIELIESVDLSEVSMLTWFDTVRTVSSPGDKTRVLIRSSTMIEGNDVLVEAYIDAAETISSPGDRRRALEALLN